MVGGISPAGAQDVLPHRYFSDEDPQNFDFIIFYGNQQEASNVRGKIEIRGDKANIVNWHVGAIDKADPEFINLSNLTVERKKSPYKHSDIDNFTVALPSGKLYIEWDGEKYDHFVRMGTPKAERRYLAVSAPSDMTILTKAAENRKAAKAYCDSAKKNCEEFQRACTAAIAIQENQIGELSTTATEYSAKLQTLNQRQIALSESIRKAEIAIWELSISQRDKTYQQKDLKQSLETKNNLAKSLGASVDALNQKSDKLAKQTKKFLGFLKFKKKKLKRKTDEKIAYDWRELDYYKRTVADESKKLNTITAEIEAIKKNLAATKEKLESGKTQKREGAAQYTKALSVFVVAQAKLTQFSEYQRLLANEVTQMKKGIEKLEATLNSPEPCATPESELMKSAYSDRDNLDASISEIEKETKLFRSSFIHTKNEISFPPGKNPLMACMHKIEHLYPDAQSRYNRELIELLRKDAFYPCVFEFKDNGDRCLTQDGNEKSIACSNSGSYEQPLGEALHEALEKQVCICNK
jgi:hypothetical protein